MRRLAALAPALTILWTWPSPAGAETASHVHVVTAANQSCIGDRCTLLAGSSWYLNHSEVRTFATSNWNPPGSPGVYYAGAVAQDILHIGIERRRTLTGPPGAMPLGAAFNVLAVRQEPCVYLHIADAGNTVGNVTYLDRASLNGNPGAFLHAMQSVSSPDPEPIGVYYDSDQGRWGVFNEDESAMSFPANFVIYDHTCDIGLSPSSFVQCVGPTTNSCGLGGIGASDPRARLLVTQLWRETSQVYNPHPIGVYWNGSHWRVFNEDLAAMPNGAFFHVSVINVLLKDGFEGGDAAAWSGGAP